MSNIEVDIKPSQPKGFNTSELSVSLTHMRNAQLFIRLTKQIEDEYSTSKPSEIIKNQHIAYAMNCIYSTIASLEATINDFLINAWQSHEKVYDIYKKYLSIWFKISDKKIDDILKREGTFKKYRPVRLT